jgi:hypothetical protein
VFDLMASSAQRFQIRWRVVVAIPITVMHEQLLWTTTALTSLFFSAAVSLDSHLGSDLSGALARLQYSKTFPRAGADVVLPKPRSRDMEHHATHFARFGQALVVPSTSLLAVGRVTTSNGAEHALSLG